MKDIRLAQAAEGRNNNLNLIRLLSACAVLVSHSYVLIGRSSDEPLINSVGLSLGSVAVDIFFVISGYLVADSAARKRSLRKFLWARCIRIYPALWVAIAVTALLFSPLIATLTAGDYYSRFEVWEYVFRNGTLIFGVKHHLPGVFTSNPYPSAVNGSLWTLPHELRCYVCLGGCFWLTSRLGWDIHRRRMLISFAAVGLVATLLIAFLLGVGIIPWLRPVAMFATGATYQAWKHKIVLCWRIAAIGCAVYLMITVKSMFSVSVLQVIYILLIPYVVMVAAYTKVPRLGFYNAAGDYSYGLYIYAFPVQQYLIFRWPSINVLQMIAVSLVITMLAALVSWHFLEKPALRLR